MYSNMMFAAFLCALHGILVFLRDFDFHFQKISLTYDIILTNSAEAAQDLSQHR